ncbi:AraC family transcriptional regulator [Xanthomonas oryzae pv. oryzae]|nr:AraC family transcriptional regulator [Xanthomonas oryzae pv. oryzae]RBG82127.1 AraC family transcriptional regulator [Xanthomonas oryzae pv. oryzae]RBG92009.1 AraC family transcriptional regulator [Xanthomonas oryzae pv. oryzae]
MRAGNRESGIGNRESGIGNRESGIGNRESGIGKAWHAFQVSRAIAPPQAPLRPGR